LFVHLSDLNFTDPQNLAACYLSNPPEHLLNSTNHTVMSNASSWIDADGDFLLVISGLTRFAPYLTGWQHFKDHIRKVVKEQPGWVDVYSSQSQRRGEMQGWARMKDVEDADAAYSTSRPPSELELQD
jgi:hypothetical protein